MHRAYPFKVAASAAVDYGLRTGLATAVCAAMLPNFGPRGLAREKALCPFYQGMADRRQRDEVFVAPPRHIPVTAEPQHIPALAGIGATVHQLSFDSPYQALHPEVRDDYAKRRRNLRAQAQHWTHGDRLRRTLIFVHGYSLDAYWINSQMFSLRWFFRQGWDIVLFTLPFHGKRRGRFDPFSGYGYFSEGVCSDQRGHAAVHLRAAHRHEPPAGSGRARHGHLRAQPRRLPDRAAGVDR